MMCDEFSNVWDILLVVKNNYRYAFEISTWNMHDSWVMYMYLYWKLINSTVLGSLQKSDIQLKSV